MAAIVNERDLLLQATVPRITPYTIDPTLIPGLSDIIAATKGLKIIGPASVMKLAIGGTYTPSSITLTAYRTAVTGVISWSVLSGTASLTGSGDTRTVTGSTMSSQVVIVRASLTENSVTYTADYQITKVSDGANGSNGSNGTNGTNGTDGTRGTLALFYTLPNLQNYPGRTSGLARWSDGTPNPANAAFADAAASQRIWSGLGNGGSPVNNAHLRIGDTVTMVNSAQNKTATGYWNGSDWLHPGTVIDGNLLVGGDISGQTFNGGTFQGANFYGSASFTLRNGSQIDSVEIGLAGALPVITMRQPSGAEVMKLSGSGVPSFQVAQFNFSRFRTAHDEGHIGRTDNAGTTYMYGINNFQSTANFNGAIGGTEGVKLMRFQSGPLNGTTAAAFSGNKPGPTASPNSWVLATVNGQSCYIPVWPV